MNKISKTYTIPAGTAKIGVTIRTYVKDKELVRFDNIQLEEKKYDSPFTESTSAAAKNLRNILSIQGSGDQILNTYVGSDNKVRGTARTQAGTSVDLLTTTETIATNQWNFVAYKWEYSNSVLKVTPI